MQETKHSLFARVQYYAAYRRKLFGILSNVIEIESSKLPRGFSIFFFHRVVVVYFGPKCRIVRDGPLMAPSFSIVFCLQKTQHLRNDRVSPEEQT
jgi:hypothetical protein